MQVNQSIQNRTKIRALNDVTKDGTRSTQKEQVLSLIYRAKSPLSLRQIARHAGIEISAACRCVSDLSLNIPPLIEVAYVGISPETGKRVKFFSYPGWKGEQPGAQLSINLHQ